MKNRIPWQGRVLAAALGYGLVGPALGQDPAPPVIPAPPAAAPPPVSPEAPAAAGEQADRILFRRLVRQVRRADREIEALMRGAMDEARGNGGEASMTTKARLLSLRDERDRLQSRLLILSMRHGWPIPADDPSAAEPERKKLEDDIFGAVDVMLRRRFTAEAQRIVEMVRLPVVSLGLDASGAERD